MNNNIEVTLTLNSLFASSTTSGTDANGCSYVTQTFNVNWASLFGRVHSRTGFTDFNAETTHEWHSLFPDVVFCQNVVWGSYASGGSTNWTQPSTTYPQAFEIAPQIISTSLPIAAWANCGLSTQVINYSSLDNIVQTVCAPGTSLTPVYFTGYRRALPGRFTMVSPPRDQLSITFTNSSPNTRALNLNSQRYTGIHTFRFKISLNKAPM